MLWQMDVPRVTTAVFCILRPLIKAIGRDWAPLALESLSEHCFLSASSDIAMSKSYQVPWPKTAQGPTCPPGVSYLHRYASRTIRPGWGKYCISAECCGPDLTSASGYKGGVSRTKEGKECIGRTLLPHDFVNWHLWCF